MRRRSSSATTIKDVAREAGVSTATVSRYLNGNTSVSPEISEQLRVVMADMKYVPSVAARHLASRKTRLIGLLLTSLHNDFFVSFLNGVEPSIRDNGYNLLIATYLINELTETPPPVGPQNTDGLVIFSDGLSDHFIETFHAAGFPMVLAHRSPPANLNIPVVTVENSVSTRCLIEHLITVHHRKRIMFLRGSLDYEDSNIRENAYKAVLTEHGFPIDERLILNGGFDRDVAHKTMIEFLTCEEHPDFDAVFTGNDDAAIGALRALHQNRIKVPEEVSVVGFDDLGFARFLHPPLTTVRAPTDNVGRLAGEQLIKLIENQAISDRLVLPTEVVYRRSCGCQYEFETEGL